MKHASWLLACACATAPTWANEHAPTPKPDVKIERSVIEDDGVRIDELRVRGESVRILVRSKVGNLPGYEIVPLNAARDPSRPSGAGLAGQRVWSLFTF